jgi:hypothetical protein
MEAKNYKGYYADCYVLTKQRTQQFVDLFLEKFLPEREEAADEYEVPQYSDKAQHVFTSIDKIVTHLVINPQETYSLYWRNKASSDLKGAMLFFTSDGNIIAGLFCNALENDSKIENDFLFKLKAFCKSERGYIDYENPPPLTVNEFPV